MALFERIKNEELTPTCFIIKFVNMIKVKDFMGCSKKCHES